MWMQSERETGRTSRNLSFSLMAHRQCPASQTFPYRAQQSTNDERSPPAFVKTNAGPLQPGKRNHGLPQTRDLPHKPILVLLVLQSELEREGAKVGQMSVGGMVLRRGTGGLGVPLCRRFPMRRYIVSLVMSVDGSDLRGAYIAVKLCFWS